MDKETYNKIIVPVRRAARSVATKWSGIVEADDLEQELWLYILESDAVKDYLLRHSDGECVNALSRKANAIASQERVDYEYFIGSYRYTPRDIPKIFDRIHEGSEMHCEKADLEVALDYMKYHHPRYYECIIQAYVTSDLDVSINSNSKRKQLSTEKLTNIMNRTFAQRDREAKEKQY